MYSVYVNRSTSVRLPHSEIPGSKSAYDSPRLIAVNHVLHRLLVPRHSPCALCSLTFSFNPPLFSALPSPYHDGKFQQNIRRQKLCDPLKFEIVEFSLVYEISLITLILIKSYDFSRRSSYDSLFLSFVLHFFVQFSRCDFQVLSNSEFNI